MIQTQEVSALIAVYNENNQMFDKCLVNKILASGESVSQEVDLQYFSGQTVKCFVFESFTNRRKIAKTFVAE